MASTMPDLGRVRQHLLPEKAGPSARADLRKTEKDGWRLVGRAIDGCRWLCRLSVKEFAGLMNRDERQVRAWISGEEQPQVAAVFAVPLLQEPFVIALAEQAGSNVIVDTVITLRRAGR